MVRRLAVAKAAHVASGFGSGVLVLGADTAVVLDGDALGKPLDAADAAAMLLRLGGREHRIVTGYCLWESGAGSLELGSVETEVAFRPISHSDAEAYVATGEPLGKAGSYAIQGVGRKLVSEIRGSFTNVMGLPMETIIELLDHHGVPRSSAAE
jgi:septum formation protein